jgi:hypothetical protein
VLIDPETQSALGDGFERAIADLHYGTVAINAWTAFGFLTPTATWGAFPGGTLDDAPSGIGIVHNAFLLDRVERTVVRGPFRPFPRSASSAMRGYGLSVLPKPPWFVTSRTGAAVCEGFTLPHRRQLGQDVGRARQGLRRMSAIGRGGGAGGAPRGRLHRRRGGLGGQRSPRD